LRHIQFSPDFPFFSLLPFVISFPVFCSLNIACHPIEQQYINELQLYQEKLLKTIVSE